MGLSYAKRIDLGFFVAIVLICSVVSSVYASFNQMNHQKGRVDHTYQVISALQEVISDLSDVQGSVRGYIITGLEDYLAPYHLAMPKAEDTMSSLDRLLADNPEQHKRYASLKEHIQKRIQIAEQAIDTYRKQGQDAAIESIRGGSGKREMDEIRAIVGEMINEENNLLDIRKTAVEDFTKLTLYAGAAGVFICLVILLTVFYLIHYEFSARSKTEVSLRDAVGEMERHNVETKLVSQMGDYLRSCRERHEVYGVIAESLPQLFPQSFGSICVFNEAHTALGPAMTWGTIPEGISHEFEPEDCWALRQGRGHLSHPDNAAPRCPHLEKMPQDNVSFCLPMQAQGETIGLMYFGARAAEAQHVGKHEMGTMRRIAEQISLALANLDLQQALKEQSIKDPLTKLYNRRYLEETLPRELARMQRADKKLGVMIMDIDHFKKVNDTYGHDGGDAVLVAFANVLSQKVRKEDIACRLGGEEFVLILPDVSAELAHARAEEIRAATSKLAIKHNGQTIGVSVSIGVSLYPDHGDAQDQLLARADQCLYQAKNAGRDRVVVYDGAGA